MTFTNGKSAKGISIQIKLSNTLCMFNSNIIKCSTLINAK